MWWTFLAVLTGASADPAVIDQAPVAQVDKAQAVAALVALPVNRRAEVRCAMLANLATHEVGRGVRKDDFGLTDEKAEILAGRLAELIVEERLADARTVRAMYNADFESLAAERMAMADAQGEAMFQAEMAKCSDLYSSVTFSEKGDGIVLGFSRSARPGDDAANCYALLRHISAGVPPKSREGKAFAAMLQRLEELYVRESGTPAAAAGSTLQAVSMVMGVTKFEALSEEEAEPQIERCMKLAGA